MALFPSPIPFTEPWEYELSFPPDPRGPGVARTVLRAVLAAHGLDELAGRAELLTSELATNALRYSMGRACVLLRWLHPVLRVSVRDGNPVLPRYLPKPALAVEPDRGRGLLILDLVADRWGGFAIGAEPVGPVGKTIWFELSWGGPPVAAAPTAV